ncbi:MAG: 2-amino-4-hydroxy-6-hydroxymethyldihydropteridine diphosphokinase [Solimonas sp.]
MSGRATIGLGANLGDPAARLRWALTRIAGLGAIEAQSPLYRSAPMGPPGQPDFCNAVAIVRTGLAPVDLMQALLAIERETGRVRGVKWGPRTLDLDLLDFDGTKLDLPGLHLPHPGIANRNFVLAPWADIAPDAVIPGVGRIGDAAAAIGRQGLTPWDSAD